MERFTPETPSDLQHPGLASDGTPPDGQGAVAAPDVSPSATDNWPIFDDPIIGWWENAWALREANLDGSEPLI